METAIKIENLSKSYDGKTVLHDLNLDIATGEIFGLLGANGAGKTTAVECVLGTRKADGGQAVILGLDPVRNRKTLFQRVGVQFQEGSYQEKIQVGELCEEFSSIYKDTVDYRQLLKEFNLDQKIKSPVNELSGGQRQRLFIVLALIPDPKVVFLDELTTGLDARARREVWKNLSRLREKGVTMLMTSHFMDEVEILCDRIGILKKGELIFCGTVKEAVEKSPCDKFEDAYLWYSDEEEPDDESF